jgi:hypothetical protein
MEVSDLFPFSTGMRENRRTGRGTRLCAGPLDTSIGCYRRCSGCASLWLTRGSPQVT